MENNQLFIVLIVLAGVAVLYLCKNRIKEWMGEAFTSMANEAHYSMDMPLVGWLRQFLAQQGWCKQTLCEAETREAYLECERGSNEIFRIYLELVDGRQAVVLREFNKSDSPSSQRVFYLDSDHQEDLKELEQYIQRNYFNN